MDSKANTPFYADKSFWLVIFGFVATIVAKKWGAALNVEELAALAATVVSFVVGNKWKSGAVLAAEIKAEAVKAAAAAPAPASPAAALFEAGK